MVHIRQKLDDSLESKRQLGNLPFHEKYRKYIGVLIPFLFFQICWWSLAIRYDLFRLYPSRYEMAITMIFGAFVAGATSEGGGAVAFPVMVLLLHIQPTVAPVSVILGLQFLDDVLSAAQKKMLFVSIWFAFACSLLLLNLKRKRVTYDRIPQFTWWKAVLLFVTGLFGGLLTAWTGSGVDICSFSILTLLFRVSEKVATPTSVLLMFINTCVGFYWRQLIITGVSELAWEYFAVSVPVVVICSPIGAHRQVLASFVYALETIAVIGWLITGPPIVLVLVGALIVVVGSAFFYGVSYAGKRLSDSVEANRTDSADGIVANPLAQTPAVSAVDLRV
ncbi:hypothetical protein M3Y99_01950000 [Aphelenchoides fujianensis]|nr:hypothetical protein M3Y99_01950000 [Aphelenchoides fujianensis]